MEWFEVQSLNDLKQLHYIVNNWHFLLHLRLFPEHFITFRLILKTPVYYFYFPRYDHKHMYYVHYLKKHILSDGNFLCNAIKKKCDNILKFKWPKMIQISLWCIPLENNTNGYLKFHRYQHFFAKKYLFSHWWIWLQLIIFGSELCSTHCAKRFISENYWNSIDRRNYGKFNLQVNFWMNENETFLWISYKCLFCTTILFATNVIFFKHWEITQP